VDGDGSAVGGGDGVGSGFCGEVGGSDGDNAGDDAAGVSDIRKLES
jgi:hypothetical protein